MDSKAERTIALVLMEAVVIAQPGRIACASAARMACLEKEVGCGLRDGFRPAGVVRTC